jgi:hypothetical protein
MKTGFKDRLQVPEGKKMKNPWDFTNTTYDQRTSGFITAGTDYGVGKAQPIGKFEASNEGGVPYGRGNHLETDYVHRGMPNKVIELELGK